MSNSDYLYVFAGRNPGHIMGSFMQYMREKGDSVFEISTLDSDCSAILDKIGNRKIVYITAEHIALDTENIRRAGYYSSFSISNLELMEMLKPVKSILYTHDLGQIIGKNEEKYIDLFDIVLFPYICNEFYLAKRQYSRIEEIGWIKKKNNFLRVKERIAEGTAVYFPSNMSLSINRYGIEGFAKWIEKMIDKSVKIKPSEYAPMFPVLEILKRNGYSVLDASLNVYDIAESAEIIITNGCSSITFEGAYSGCPIISVLDGFEPDERYIKDKPQLKWCYSLQPQEVHPFLEKVKSGKMVLEEGQDVLKPFDYEKAYRLIKE